MQHSKVSIPCNCHKKYRWIGNIVVQNCSLQVCVCLDKIAVFSCHKITNFLDILRQIMERLQEFNKNVQQFRQQVRSAIPTDDCVCLPQGFQPRQEDVICARGKDARDHPGNQKFRSSLEINLDRYIQADSKYKKTLIVSEIVSTVYQTNGHFVRQANKGQWYQVSDDAAREKAGQALRDMLQKQKKHSSRNQHARVKKKCKPKHNDQQECSSPKPATCKTKEVSSTGKDVGDSKSNDQYKKIRDNWNSSDSSSIDTASVQSELDNNYWIYEPLPLYASASLQHSPEWLEELQPLLQSLCYDEKTE